MKKIIALLIALAVFSTTSVFAQQSKSNAVPTDNVRLEVSNVNTQDNLTITKANLQENQDDLFATVSATPLTNEEAELVDGGFMQNVFGAIAGAALGAVTGIFIAGPPGMVVGLVVGGAVGGITGSAVGGVSY